MNTWAQAPSPSSLSATEAVDQLVAQLDADSKALDTSNCDTACRALASMKRAAERICELEPGPRCEAARDKVEAARKKVQAACPDCAAASEKSAVKPDAPKPTKPPRQPGPPSLDPDAPKPPDPTSPRTKQDMAPEDDRPISTAPPPAEAQSRGGCVPCGIGSGGSAWSAWLLLLVTVVVGWRRRRRPQPSVDR